MVTSPIPAPGSRRRHLERIIWILDLVAWLGILGVGIGLVANPPMSILITAKHQPLLPFILAGLFLIGGLWGFIVRLLRLGLFEGPAIWIAGGGLVVFGINAGIAAAIANYPGTVAICFAVTLASSFARKSLDLYALASEANPTLGAAH